VIWVVLAFVGVPLWLIAAGLLLVVRRTRQLRHREGNVAVRVHGLGKAPAKGWRRGNAVWVHDVFAFRGWPAAWSEVLAGTSSASTRAPSREEEHALRHLDAPVVALLTLDDGDVLQVAAPQKSLPLLLGPYAVASSPA
jgi:hypothetical protein